MEMKPELKLNHALYQLDADYNLIFEEIDDYAGFLTFGIKKRLRDIDEDIENKAIRLAEYIHHKQCLANNIETEIMRLKDRQRILENGVVEMKQFLAQLMNEEGLRKSIGLTLTVEIDPTNTSRVRIK